jgi:hypothetical protein
MILGQVEETQRENRKAKQVCPWLKGWIEGLPLLRPLISKQSGVTSSANRVLPILHSPFSAFDRCSIVVLALLCLVGEEDPD